MKITTIGLDLAKNVLQVQGVDSQGHAVMRKQLRRRGVLPYIAKLEPRVVGMEAPGSSHDCDLQFELDESMGMTGREETAALLPELAGRCISLAIDDFGIGTLHSRICRRSPWIRSRLIGRSRPRYGPGRPMEQSCGPSSQWRNPSASVLWLWGSSRSRRCNSCAKSGATGRKVTCWLGRRTRCNEQHLELDLTFKCASVSVSPNERHASSRY